jgi:hypothetical protein
VRIFVCYRREDSAPWAGRLHDALAERFGAGNIFQDVEAVRAGESFVEAMDAAVAKADAMLVVIGPRWAAPHGDGRSRLEAADDYVRRELEVGLAYGKRLVPVLVGGARMPTAGDVPDDLRPVVTRQAVVLRDESWHADVGDLARALDRGPSATIRRNRGPAIAAAAVLLAAAAAVTYALSTRADGDGGDATGAESTGLVSAGALPECATPRGDGWGDLTVRSTAGSGQGTYFDFSVTSGAERDVDGATEVVFVVAATVLPPSSEILYPEGWTVIPAQGFRQSCFSLARGGPQADPTQTITAYVGFRGSGRADEINAIGVSQRGGETNRLDLETTG